MTRSRLVVAHACAALACLSLAGCLAHERDLGDGGVLPVDAGMGIDVGSAPDAFVVPDGGGTCECPRPPPGCVYDGVPCGCSHTTCAPIHCGRTVCSPGTVCCNESCGTCVPPGFACTDQECAPDCSPQDAHSGGRCAGDAGYAWDGTACRQIACRCVGSECDRAFATEAECNAYFGSCPPEDCHTDDATGVGGCAVVLGYGFTSRGCMPVSGCSCTGADCASVMGRSEQACNDAHAMCPILFL